MIWSGVAVVTGSFALIVVSFALHYARRDATVGGLAFPGGTAPRFADYLYFSVQVSTTFGGSDVDVTTTRMRTAVTLHSVIAFTYNTVMVALLVSVLLNTAA